MDVSEVIRLDELFGGNNFFICLVIRHFGWRRRLFVLGAGGNEESDFGVLPTLQTTE